jgi:phage terminase large subunit-like protein
MERWHQAGFLESCPGNLIDVDQVAADAIKDIQTYKPKCFCFDEWQSILFTNTIGKQCKDLVLVGIKQDFKNLSPPMLELDALIADKRIRHADNPILNWNMANVMALSDNHDNIKPVKDSKRSSNKIDGGVALIMAISRGMLTQPRKVEPFRAFFA